MEQHPGSLGRSGGGSTSSGPACRSAASLDRQPGLPRHRARLDLRLPLHLGQAAARRLLAPPLPAVAADQERGCSPNPVVALDVALNSTFLVASAVVLLSTGRERPAMPIRAWAFGYALQCLIHVALLCVELGRRRRRMRERGRWPAVGEVEEESRSVKRLKSINAIISLLWWILGFHWIVAGGQALLQDAPRLYWLTVVFLSFDVFFAFFCVMLASAIGVALFCCLPFTMALLQAVAGEGASDTHFRTLPTFRFCQANQPDKMSPEQVQVSITNGDQDSINGLSLPPEDSECCICLCQYEEGVELLSLPCNHHFHSGCVIKWMRINTTCPLCKHDIREEDEDDIPV